MLYSELGVVAVVTRAFGRQTVLVAGGRVDDGVGERCEGGCGSNNIESMQGSGGGEVCKGGRDCQIEGRMGRTDMARRQGGGDYDGHGSVVGARRGMNSC